MPDRAFLKQMEGYGLTTAEIHYHLPDHPSVLQLYVWQEYDLAPKFPELKAFLDFWSHEIEGKLHSVVVAHKRLIAPLDLRSATNLGSVH
ncbi:usg protein [Pelagibacterium sp. H642]|uniref:usg protein n=1 Tax=Pelagibacterium sp. H642 TaxID=1881069 RepID=UPI0028149B5A|nr:usg protein [Pelagibacterium sp. H642]WMT92693.1 usg protein [Pelagibacterium sp. H642]